MGKEWFVYSFVARGSVILAEHVETYMSNIPAMAAQCLQRLPSTATKFTYNYDNHTLNFLVEDGYAYCVAAKENAGRQISEAFLERVKADFKNKYGGGKADTMIQEKSLNKDLGMPRMKDFMRFVEEHGEEMDKIVKLKAQVSDVISVMSDNIDKAMDRGQNLTTLSEKAEDLRDQAKLFEKRGTEMRRKMWYQNIKIKLAVLGIILVLALIIWLSICRGFSCN